MVSKFALLSNILLATAALVAPSSVAEDTLARRSEDRQSLSISSVASRADAVLPKDPTNRAGVVWVATPGNVTSVTGTFTIPHIKNSYGKVTILVAIDGCNCTNSGFSVGVTLKSNGRGNVTSSAWVQWRPDLANELVDFPVRPHDTIEINIPKHSPTDTLPAAKITNHGNGKWRYIPSPGSYICQSAELLVQADSSKNGAIDPLANFSPVTFNSISFNGIRDIPSDAHLLDIVQNDVALTNTSTSARRSVLRIQRIRSH